MTDSPTAGSDSSSPDYPALIRALIRALSDDWPDTTTVAEVITNSWAKQYDGDVEKAKAYFGKQAIGDYLGWS